MKATPKELRTLVADLVSAAGCACCRDNKKWCETTDKLGKILKVPKYKDGSGYNFYKFKSLT